MWPLGHAAVAYLLYSLWTRTTQNGATFRQPGAEGSASIAVAFLLIGSQFPDLVDKPLAWYFGMLPTGRTLAHSLLFLVPVVLVVGAVTARHDRLEREYGIVFAIGAISHVLVDAVPALWGGGDWYHLLWPLTPVEPYESGAPSVIDLFVSSLGDPYFLLEFVLAGIAFVVWYRDGRPGLSLVKRTLSREPEPHGDG
ncbi:metal-dependent hydrolase [Halobacteria archaeon AArc-curdl1]|uniref:Metal-dependent hydrolase n=1 Tax=Natronosalvus hydrolyticus TaxID=2979988 RepID=A0AAP2Z770_9EURY|nr:metal-dependent hydrolase [Halobacteria archaeon AArc-curdl1]